MIPQATMMIVTVLTAQVIQELVDVRGCIRDPHPTLPAVRSPLIIDIFLI